MPAALAAATQLRRLELSFNDGMQMSADAVLVLSSLPALTTLSLTKPHVIDQRVWDMALARVVAHTFHLEMSRPSLIKQCCRKLGHAVDKNLVIFAGTVAAILFIDSRT